MTEGRGSPRTRSSFPPAQNEAPMPGLVVLPELGESVTEGTITRWLKDVGDIVEVDEPLLEVSTDKVDTEIPSPWAGRLAEILIKEDAVAEIGASLARIEEATAPTDSPLPVVEDREAGQPVAAAPAAAPAVSAAAAVAPARTDRHAPYATPLARKLARQAGLDLAAVVASGPGGRITLSDVGGTHTAVPAAAAASVAVPVPAAAAPAPAQAPVQAPAPAAPKGAADPASLRGTTVKAPRIRQIIAERMRQSLDTSTQLTQVIEVDMTRIASLRTRSKDAFQKAHGAKLTFLPFFALAVVEGLAQHPVLNASYDEGRQEITYHHDQHLAVAVDTDKGLLVPVVFGAGEMKLDGLSKGIADVAQRARSGKIGAHELSGGTFSLTNIGSVGALFDTPIINQPQVGILGTGAIVKRAVVVTDDYGQDTIAFRSMVYLSLTYDHRIVDGADAGRFLQTLKGRLEGGDFTEALNL
ncbi:2-oxoglutarate dehydrogenase, E2 component, dihydrolipoamide succinyltransferase [Pseudarthrobacter sp. P1]|uniref:2-oxoglutarate dehydrogenase, E2 component, dihydrolipoamide succinyltransferase n=1 Tax=Pseudarthrobacter sp. P1 TaxID=3418418 RepID=UPI003CF93064